jgi:hypothetical protein
MGKSFEVLGLIILCDRGTQGDDLKSPFTSITTAVVFCAKTTSLLFAFREFG